MGDAPTPPAPAPFDPAAGLSGGPASGSEPGSEPGDARRRRALAAFRRAGRESSRLSVLFRSAISARLGLGLADAECLDFLLEAGSATAGQLAERTNLTTGAVTGMIRRLEAAGYVTSRRDPEDRRRVIVTPVPERIAEGAELYASFGRAGERITAAYTTEELELLVRHYEAMSGLYAAQLDELRRAR